MARNLATWAVVPLAALVFAVSFIAGLGVIESITVTALATIVWNVGWRALGGLAGAQEASDGPRD